MEELLAQLQNNCFSLALFLSSFFHEHSFLVLSRAKNFPPQKNSSQVQVVVSDKIAPVFWIMTHKCKASSWAYILPAYMLIEGKFYLFDHEEENSFGEKFSTT